MQMPIIAVIRPACISLYPEYKAGFFLYMATELLEMANATIPKASPGNPPQKQEIIEKIPSARVAPELGNLLISRRLFP